MSIAGPAASRASLETFRPPVPVRRWPAWAAATYIGLFCLITSTAVGWNMALGATWADSGVVILAITLRLLTVALALASVQAWGRRVPSWIVLAGLWGAAAVQLVYPIAETVVKGLILTGLMEPIDKGISNMTPEGWFNFGATWVVWGIPGVLFLLAALSYRARNPVKTRWVVLGILGGAVLLGGLGFVIG
ncbi:hypothetical protein [Actinoplanes philippinensis]|uniref:hypothetical protein n=1 Tax=Actinoplanes philippinensis TaxID=35752 RepID=UPI00340C46F6